MKARKARKRLRRVEELLTTVIEEYSEGGVHDLLDTAKTAVTNALTSLPRSNRKPPSRAAKARQEKPRAAKKRSPAEKAAAAGEQLNKAG